MSSGGRQQSLRRAGAAVAIAVAVALAGSAPAAARPYLPPKKRAFHGVSDRGKLEHFFEFQDAVGAHPAVLQNFVTWGEQPDEAYRHWHKTRTRGMLSISTAPGYAEPGVITPRQIARGRGDGYILRLNRELRQVGDPVYIRLLPEMNGHWNTYSAFNADGSSRGKSHKTRWFRRAWRRFTLIVRGGKLARINRKLRRAGLAPVRPRWVYHRSGLPKRLPRPAVALIWVPQFEGSPDRRGNGPRAYWPGSRYVDWVGLDTYSKFADFRSMHAFYKHRRWNRKPFMVGEYAPWDYDDDRWVARLFRWERKHPRARMLVYYQGFGEAGNPFLIDRYPNARDRLRAILRRPHYMASAPGSADGLAKVPGR